jgi:selenocysteine lyase/cysteine desulfurase
MAIDLDSRLGFGDFSERVWLNCAHQGPLPLTAAEEAREAIEWKLAPWELTQERFDGIPLRLKRALGRLTGLPAEEIILTNGASYGLHLFANGLPLAAGDEVLLMRGDFPSNLLPWLGLERRGVRVRLLEPRRFVLRAEEIEPQLGPRTRVLCMSWVHSFSGFRADLDAIGALCRAHGVRFLVNTTQGLGTRPLDLANTPVDGVTNAGWKWLCGPYGTGFCWLRDEVLDELDYNQAYWLTTQTAEDLGRPDAEPRLPEGIGARRYDVFSTASFFNAKPWAAAIEHLLDVGLETIAERDRGLVARLVEGFDRNAFELLSPDDAAERTTLVFLSHREVERNGDIYDRLIEAGIHVAFRRGHLRVSPHLYNTAGDVDRLLEVLGESRT